MLMLLADRYRRQAHAAAWYDDPSDEPSNLPITLRNPFGKRKFTSSTRDHDDLHMEEAGEKHDGKSLRPIRTDAQDYRPTTPQDRARELGLVEPPPHSATTPNVDSANDLRNEKLDIPRADSPVNGDNTADKIDPVEEQRGHDSISSETAVENGVSNRSPLDGNHEVMHQRKKGAMERVTGLFHKKAEDDNDDHDDPDAKNKPKKVFTPMSQVRATILNSWINILLIACEYSPRRSFQLLTVFSPGRYRTLLCPRSAGRRFRGQLHRYHPSSRNA